MAVFERKSVVKCVFFVSKRSENVLPVLEIEESISQPKGEPFLEIGPYFHLKNGSIRLDKRDSVSPRLGACYSSQFLVNKSLTSALFKRWLSTIYMSKVTAPCQKIIL